MAMPMCSSALELNSKGWQARIATSNKADQSQASSSCSTVSSAKYTAQRWSKEALVAMETHLALLQQQGSARLSASNKSKPTSNGTHFSLVNHAAIQNEDSKPLVEISSQGSLPEGWEQHLDLQTGQVYYIDWKSCKRSSIDPRKVLQLANERICLLLQQDSEGWELQSSVTEELERRSECITSQSSSLYEATIDEDMEVESKWTHMEACNNHEFDPKCNNRPSLEAKSEDNLKLEMMGCHHCLSLFMIHRANPWCPHCGHALV